jgi:hypothetical protein
MTIAHKPLTAVGIALGRYARTCRVLGGVASVAIGVAAGGIAWSVCDFDRFGPTLVFSAFVIYLILTELRARLTV